MSRTMEPSDYLFTASTAVESFRVKSIEGAKEKGLVTIRPLMVGEKVLVLELFEEKGVEVPPHRHDDHESIVYLIRGRLKLRIGEQEFVAESGCIWRHPAKVEHSSVALEESLMIEIKSPPRKTWK